MGESIPWPLGDPFANWLHLNRLSPVLEVPVVNTHKDVLAMLAKAPETQIDSSITPRLQKLSEQDEIVPKEFLTILDDCAFCSLASDFAMSAMNVVLQSLVREHQELGYQT